MLGPSEYEAVPVIDAWDETAAFRGVRLSLPPALARAHERPGQVVKAHTDVGEAFFALASAPDPGATAELLVKRDGRVADALVRKGYVERLPDQDDARAGSLRVTSEGRQLYEKINSELIEQQADLLRDLDPQMRAAATEIIQRLARAAQARFVSGVSVGSCAPACGNDAAAKCG